MKTDLDSLYMRRLERLMSVIQSYSGRMESPNPKRAVRNPQIRDEIHMNDRSDIRTIERD